MEEKKTSIVGVGYPNGEGIEIEAGLINPMEVVEGHLRIFNDLGYVIASFAPGMWTAAVVKSAMVSKDKD